MPFELTYISHTCRSTDFLFLTLTKETLKIQYHDFLAFSEFHLNICSLIYLREFLISSPLAIGWFLLPT